MREIKLKLTERDVEVKDEELDNALDSEARASPRLTEARTKALSNREEKARSELNKRRVVEWEGELINGIDLYNHPNLFLRRQYRDIIDSGGKIYLILEADTVVGIQPHKPFVQGVQLMKNEGELENTASEHIKQIVHNNLLALAVRETKRKY